MEVKREAKYEGARALVAGATGFIGRWVAKSLSDDGADLSLVGRDFSRLESFSKVLPIRGERIVADLSDPEVVERTVKEIRPDITFNLLGYGVSPSEKEESLAWRINAEAAANIAVALNEAVDSDWRGLRLVHVGSGFEYGPLRNGIKETTVAEPYSLYGKSKLEGTRRLREIAVETGLRLAVARPFNVYGPGEPSHRLLPSLFNALETGSRAELSKGDQERDFMYVQDVATGLLKIGLREAIPGHIINLATGTPTSVRDFAVCAAELMGLSRSQLDFGAIPHREDEFGRIEVDIGFMKKCIRWVPSYTIRDGIRETIEVCRLIEKGAN